VAEHAADHPAPMTNTCTSPLLRDEFAAGMRLLALRSVPGRAASPLSSSMTRPAMTRFDSTSWSLVLGAAAAVPKDQEEFGRRYGPLVRGYFSSRWRLSMQDARIADASQEVFLRIFSPGGPLTRVDKQRPSGFRAFLRGVLHNVAAELERRDRRDRTSPLDSDMLPIDQSEQSPSGAFDRVWAEMITDAAWELMREKAKRDRWAQYRLQVLGHRYVDDMSCEQIAAQISELTVDQVYRLLTAGRSQFRSALMTVLSAHHPELLPEELEQKCREVVEAL
tara:strand:- start:185426 stop:186262 length:837 start_codon:yes stop_codon:yes gene_type:complete